MKSGSLLVFLRLTKIIPLKIPRSNLDNIQSIKVRLSNHATFTSLQWDIKRDFDISWSNLFSEIISFNEYNFIHLNHNSFSLMGFHGPYNIKNVNHKRYDLIDSEFFYRSLNNILEKDHWLQPPIDNSKVSILLHRAKDLSKSASDIYMLNSSFHKPRQPYDHEWSHAFIEYYEYFVITQNRVFVWSLVYE